MNNINNPCNHTGFESSVCEICGYPNPSKMIAELKKQIEDGECCGNCKHYSKRSDCVSKHNMDAHSVCDYWTSDGKTMEERK